MAYSEQNRQGLSHPYDREADLGRVRDRLLNYGIDNLITPAVATTHWTDLHDTVTTGAAGAIGQSITQGLLNQGVHVVMADLNNDTLARVAGSLDNAAEISVQPT